MKVYQVSFRDASDDEHKGYSYYTSRGAVAVAEGQAAARNQRTDITEFDVEISKAGILRALNVHAGHADNG